MKKIKNFIKNEIILSLLFGLWIFIILLFAEILFNYYEYNNLENKIKNKLISKSKTVETIVKNRYVYAEKKNDYTLYQLVKKWLENTLITKKWEIVINYFPTEINEVEYNNFLNIENKTFINYLDYKIYKLEFNDWSSDEEMIIYLIEEKNYNNMYFLNNLILFIIIDFIIFILSSLIWYLFIKRILRKIEENIKHLKEFTSDINHELKTPLSIIKSSLELYKKENWENEYVSDSINAANNINTTLSSLSEIALYIENYDAKKENILIKKEIDNLLKIYENNIKQKWIYIITDINKNLKINIFKNDLLICISNILKNAIKYSKNNWNISISIKDNIIEIKDNWIWISEKNLNKIFNRNYSEQKWSWTWLWLSIIQKIINKNWRKIDVKSKKWVKTIFKIYY